jgi:CRISPR-associated protein Cmr6
LAAAHQNQEDCDLRPATLRGVLRWWWRTLHAGFVDTATLRQMEAAIWGDTNQGGAVAIKLAAVDNAQPIAFNKHNHAMMNDAERTGQYRIPGAPPNKTTQGLWYVSYGMDEKDKRRHFLAPGARWQLTLIARAHESMVPARLVLEQATAALWLLCSYGGVGSKTRKGFGSLFAGNLDGWHCDRCKQVARDLRSSMGISSGFKSELATTAALQLREQVEVSFAWSDPWQVLDQVGFALQAFAKKFAHKREKMALGLPRRIGRSPSDATGAFNATGPMRRLLEDARSRGGSHNIRHASPFHVHLAPAANGAPGFKVTVSTFPAACLPDFNTSKQFLDQFRNALNADLDGRARLSPPAKRPATRLVQAAIATEHKVTVTFLGAHEKNPRMFWAQEPGKKRGLIKYGTPPDQLPQLNDQIEVYPSNNNPLSPEYGWQPRAAGAPVKKRRGPHDPRR